SVADSLGPAATGTFSITFTEAAATITANTGASVAEGTTVTLTGAQLSTTTDPGDPASELVYTLTAAPTHGTLKLNPVGLGVNGTFTQYDINTGKASYTQDGTANSAPSGFSVADSPGHAATGTFSITFTEAAATITANTGASVAEGATVTLTGSQLRATA